MIPKVKAGPVHGGSSGWVRWPVVDYCRVSVSIDSTVRWVA